VNEKEDLYKQRDLYHTREKHNRYYKSCIIGAQQASETAANIINIVNIIDVVNTDRNIS